MKEVIKSVWAMVIVIFLLGGLVFNLPTIYSGLKQAAEKAANAKFSPLISENEQLKNQLAQKNDEIYRLESRVNETEENFENAKQIAIQTNDALKAKEEEYQELYDAYRAQTDSFNLSKDSVSTLLTANQTQNDRNSQLTRANAAYINQIQQLTAERNAEKALVAQAEQNKLQADLFKNILLAIPFILIMWVMVVRYRRSKKPNTVNLDPNYSRRDKSLAA